MDRMPRASGKRRSLADISPVVLDWMRSQFGDFEIVKEYKGGMSPGCAASIRVGDGDRFFVKAVDDDPDDVTADLFRHELHVLENLPPSPHRPALLGGYDDGEWVAVVMEHVSGHYPDFGIEAEFDAVADMLSGQGRELSPPPSGLSVPSLRDTVQWWISRWEEIEERPEDFLPVWALGFADVGLGAARRVADALPDDTLCHFDVRNDNLLIGDDGDVVVFDWGIAMTGPLWADKVMLALQLPDMAKSSSYISAWLDDDELGVVDDFLVAFGGSQAWDSRQPVQRRLPTLRDYLADDAERLLRAAQYRKTH